tara:strand:+ start:5458 stop:5727 length:270 start_codon:yes stop_codon:yes gene_type:complete
MGVQDAHELFGRGLLHWNLLVQRIDFDEFKDILESVRGFRISEEYALQCWELFPNPMELKLKLKGEFTKFSKLATMRTSGFGIHRDLTP